MVKSYGPRGMLHLLPADELPLWMAAMRGRQDLVGTPWYEAPGPPPDAPGGGPKASGPMERAEAQALLAAIGDVLDGRCLTRDELVDEVGGRLGPWARDRLDSRWATPPIGQAALTGRLCFGPNKGAQITFVRADQWIGGWKEQDPRQALLEICRRYLATYGPATHQDFAEWFSLKPSEARTLFQSLAPELVEVEVDGRRAWLPPDDTGIPRAADLESVRLVPQYDCNILGVRQRDQILPPTVRTLLLKYTRGQQEGPVGMSWVVLGGVLAGIWERRARGRRTEIRVEPARRLGRDHRRGLEAQVARIGEFLGTDIAFVIKPPP